MSTAGKDSSVPKIDIENVPFRKDENGNILNELGRIAKGKDIVYRDEKTGYPLIRAQDLVKEEAI